MSKSIQELQQEAATVKPLESKLRQLQEQARLCEREVISLKLSYSKEQADIDKLEGRSLANYFFQVIGRMDDRLDQERREAYAAKVKLDGAEAELENIRRDVSRTQTDLAQARTAEYLLQQELTRKRQALRNSGTQAGERILELEQKIAELEARKKEIREAESAGYRAKSNCDQILSHLDSADDWNTWDLIGGGGIITHVAKHGHLDDAQDLISVLQSNLRQFQTELADIRITASMQVNADGFLRFADYFFDGLFADFAMKGKIDRSHSSVSHTKRQVQKALEQLRALEKSTDRELAERKQQLEELTVQS